MSERSGAPVIEATGLVLAHGDHVALARSDLSVPAGTLVACIGPNGSGKSSLLDALSGVLRPVSGSLSVLGGPPGGGDLAYVFQSTEIPSQLPLTVREVVTMGRYRTSGLLGRIGPDGHRAVQDAMERLEVSDLAHRQLLELSGGQRQRVLVAQGLASQAPLLILDEPMTGLDLVSRHRILEVVRAERDRGCTVVISTHDLGEAAAADVAVLLAGRVVAAGAPADVLTEEHLLSAYSGRVLEVGGVRIIDDPHHHGPRSDRHDGHDHRHDPADHGAA